MTSFPAPGDAGSWVVGKTWGAMFWRPLLLRGFAYRACTRATPELAGLLFQEGKLVCQGIPHGFQGGEQVVDFVRLVAGVTRQLVVQATGGDLFGEFHGRLHAAADMARNAQSQIDHQAEGKGGRNGQQGEFKSAFSPENHP